MTTQTHDLGQGWFANYDGHTVTVRNPDKGQRIDLTEESVDRLRAIFAAAVSAQNYVTTSAFGDWAKFVPKGMVGVCARVGGHEGPAGAIEKWFLIPAAEYRANRAESFVIDLEKHQEIAEPGAGMIY